MSYKVRNQHKRHWRVLLPLILLVLLIIGCLVAFFHYHASKSSTPPAHVRSVNSVDYSPAKPNDNVANEDRKSSANPSATLNNGSSASGSSSTASNFGVHIVSASANNGNVHVGTLVNGASSGNCILTASQSGQTSVVRTSAVQQDVNDYDCGVFNIATGDFPSNGTWKLTLSVSSGGQQAADTSTVNF